MAPAKVGECGRVELQGPRKVMRHLASNGLPLDEVHLDEPFRCRGHFSEDVQVVDADHQADPARE
jgi:hypothetical protein